MDCKKAQSLVTPYILNQLTEEELAEFMDHIGSCSECREELEIYFTVHQTLIRLDYDDSGSYNVTKELEDHLAESRRRVRRKRVTHAGRMFVMILAELFLVLMLVSQIHIWESHDFQNNAVYRMVYPPKTDGGTKQ